MRRWPAAAGEVMANEEQKRTQHKIEPIICTNKGWQWPWGDAEYQIHQISIKQTWSYHRHLGTFVLINSITLVYWSSFTWQMRQLMQYGEAHRSWDECLLNGLINWTYANGYVMFGHHSHGKCDNWCNMVKRIVQRMNACSTDWSIGHMQMSSWPHHTLVTLRCISV